MLDLSSNSRAEGPSIKLETHENRQEPKQLTPVTKNQEVNAKSSEVLQRQNQNNDEGEANKNRNKIDRQSITRNLKFLKNQLRLRKNMVEQQQNSNELYVFSQKQHKDFLKKINKRKLSLSMKKKKHEQIKIIIAEKQQKKAEQAQQQHQKNVEEKKKIIEKKIIEHKHEKQDKILKKRETDKKVNELKKKKCLHQFMEQKYEHQYILPILQMNKKKLQQIKEINKALDFEALKQRQVTYLSKKSKHKTPQLLKNISWEYKKPQKSQHLLQILQEQKMKDKALLQGRKKEILRNLKRKEEYLEKLEEKIIKIDPEKREQVQKRRKQNQLIKHLEDSRVIGIKNLSFAKSKRKRKSQSENHISDPHSQTYQIIEPQKQVLGKKTIEQYDKLKWNSFKKILTSKDIDERQKISQAQIETEKIEQQARRKEIHLRSLDTYNEEDQIRILVDKLKKKVEILNLIQ